MDLNKIKVDIKIECIEDKDKFKLDTINQPVNVERVIRLAAKKYRTEYFGLDNYMANWNLPIVIPIISIILSIISICYIAMK